MAGIRTATVILIFVLCVPALAQGEERVLLWNLDAGSELSAEEKITVQNLIAAEIGKRGYQVMTEGEVGRIFQLEEKLQLCGSKTSCIAEIGSAMGAKEGVTGSLARIGNALVFTMQRLDMYAARVISRCVRKASGEWDVVLGLIPQMIAELYGDEQPEKEPGVTVAAPRKDYPMNPYKRWGHISFWTGVGTLAMGGAMTAMAADAKSDARSAGTPAKMAEAESLMDTRNALAVTWYSLGSALAVTGVVLWLLSPGDRRWAEDHGLSVLPVVTDTRAGMSLCWEF
jgi:hypothetical protein